MNAVADWTLWAESLARVVPEWSPALAITALAVPLVLALWTRNAWFFAGSVCFVVLSAGTLGDLRLDRLLYWGGFSASLSITALGVSQKTVRSGIRATEERLAHLEARLGVFLDALDARTRLVDERAEHARTALEAATRGLSNIVQHAARAPGEPMVTSVHLTPDKKQT